MSRFGIPYMGSKEFIADKILSALPAADHIYDLFGGGFSVSHCAILMKKWKHVHYNEIKSDLCGLIRDAIAGKYSYANFKPPWVSREDFAKNLHDPYIRVCWSFGNNQKTYLFSEENEKSKRSLHNAVVFSVFDDLAISLLRIFKWPDKFDYIRKRRLYARGVISKRRGEQLERLERLEQLEQLERLERLQQLQRLERLQQLQQLQQLERLQQLQQLQQLERLETTALSYDEVPIKTNSIIYCDPPYKGTADYGEFDHDKFLDWVEASKHPVYFSEYESGSRFDLVFQKHRKSRLSVQAGKPRPKTIEKVFANKAGVEALKEWRGQRSRRFNRPEVGVIK